MDARLVSLVSSNYSHNCVRMLWNSCIGELHFNRSIQYNWIAIKFYNYDITRMAILLSQLYCDNFVNIVVLSRVTGKYIFKKVKGGG